MRIADLLSIVLFLALPFSQTSASRPDFSGRWILVDPANAGPEYPKSLTVEQTVTRTNVYGEPMTPFVSDMRVTREFVDGPKTVSYKIGVIWGLVGAVVGGAGPATRTEYSVVWRGRALALTERVDDATREETWSLDADRLRVRITEQRANADATTIDMIFRKQ